MNFDKFDLLVKNNIDHILKLLNTKWLTSICDTYADFGSEIERSNALYITILVASTRLAETMFRIHDTEVNEQRISEYRSRRFPLFDGLKTLHLDKQDTFLNLAKRVKKNMSSTPFLYDIFCTVIDKLKLGSYFFQLFDELSARPHYFWPEHPEELKDNYGIK